MENNPKKSKALIITIIILIFLLLIGFLAYKNRDMFGGKTSGFLAKIFSPLTPSTNTKGLEVALGQAGEDLKMGDSLALSGYDANNNPIVIRASNGSSIYGFANQDILNGELGQISINSGGSSGFWDSFSTFLNNLFGNNNTGSGLINGQCQNNANNPPLCTTTNGQCLNGASNPPLCTINTNNTCLNGADNPPICTTLGNECLNGANNPPLCTTFGGNDETYQCSDQIDNDQDSLIDNLDPTCHLGGDLNNKYIPTHDSETDIPCENGASNPPLCTIFEKEKIPDLTAGGISPNVTLVKTPTVLSSIITNNGTGGTVYEFPVLFTITNRDVGGIIDDNIEEDNVSTKLKIKKFVIKIINKISSISKAIAATTTNENIDINVELSVMSPALSTGISTTATVSYTFINPGIYYIRACADKDSIGSRGVITETNEDNNCGPWTTFEVSSSLPPPGELPQCSDGNDNDRDRLIDDKDPGCHLDGDLEKEYIPSHNSESVAPGTVYECSDNLDNDDDNKIDNDDPQCHLDGDMTKEYIPDHNSESNSPSSGSEEEKNICLAMEENPLVFTDKEKAELAELLRKFYLIAPTLKTTTDIQIVYNEINQNKEFVGQLDDLINQCYSQFKTRFEHVNDKWKAPIWDGEGDFDGDFIEAPIHRFGNPWFRMNEKGIQDLYFDYGLIDKKLVSGYFSGTTKKWQFEFANYTIEGGLDCDEYFTPRPSSGDMQYAPEELDPIFVIWMEPTKCRNLDHGENNFINNLNFNACFTIAKYAGCQWHPGTYLREVERLLNIW